MARAIRMGTLPQSILLHGPAGIGKERFALWIAQAQICENGGTGESCERCSGCRMAARLEHPDIHWFFPLSRPDASSPEKLREKLEDARAAELAARRSDPLHIPSFERPPAHYLASIHTLQRIAGSRPAMARNKVFVVGDAELMVPQESSPEAANAFLKLLEEPPADTVVIITATRPGALLPTILSRVLPVRLRPLADAEIAELLAENGTSLAEAERLASLARGSVGRALRLRLADGSAGTAEQLRQKARALLDTVLSRGPLPRLAAAHGAPPAGARGEFLQLLDALAEWIRDLMAVAAGAPESALNLDAVAFLRRAVTPELSALAAAHALIRLDGARKLAEGNVNPQLILSDLLRGLQADLTT